ncbi:MAG TPA: Na-translocating system protein MpsC family protein [Solirubrobacterales bacterium]|nr:Na-translocating system protein MpsC family protein [Solirubrobacterales bacterium]
MSTTDRTGAGALDEVTRGLVRLHGEYYGKGPTKARSHMLDDTLISILEGGFTTVETTLIADGKSDAVHHMRSSFQMAMEGRFRAVVEDATSRTVIAYMSQIHTNPDLAVELFVLEPATERR